MKKSILEHYYWDIIKDIAIAMKVNLYLELGVERGVTFNAVAPYCKKAYAVDIDEHALKYIKHNKNIKWYNCSTKNFISKLTNKNIFDLVFIDADHSFDASLSDFIGIIPFVKQNGIICIHDTYPKDETYLDVNKCNDSYKTAWYIRNEMRDEFEIVTLPFYCGLSIVRKANKQLLWM